MFTFFVTFVLFVVCNSMRFRKLRITWSVGCGVFGLLLVPMWVRSAWWLDDIVMRFHDNFYIKLGSSPSTVWIVVSNGELPGTPWKLFSTSSDELAVLYARIGLSLVLWKAEDYRAAIVVRKIGESRVMRRRGSGNGGALFWALGVGR